MARALRLHGPLPSLHSHPSSSLWPPTSDESPPSNSPGPEENSYYHQSTHRPRTYPITGDPRLFNTIVVEPDHTPPTAMAADFVELSNELLSKVRDCEFLKTQELRRLHPILVQLRSENETLTTNLNTKAPTITPATLQILRKVPLKCFVTPAPGLFNEVMPRLADYKITFQDNFHGDQRFKEVINIFELFCKSEQALLQSFEAVKTLAKENQSLRTRHLLLSSGDQLAELEKSNGTLPCLNLFSTYLHTCFMDKAVI